MSYRVLEQTRRRVLLDDLLDSQGVADLLRLSHRNSVSTYAKRYPDFPKPVAEITGSGFKLWLRPDVQRWASSR